MKKNAVTIVTSEAFNYTDRDNNLKRVYYGTYGSRNGDVSICRITTTDELEIGELYCAYLIWSSKAKMFVNITIDDD